MARANKRPQKHYAGDLDRIRSEYRAILRTYDLTDDEVDAIRIHVELLAEIVRDHVLANPRRRKGH